MEKQSVEEDVTQAILGCNHGDGCGRQIRRFYKHRPDDYLDGDALRCYDCGRYYEPAYPD